METIYDKIYRLWEQTTDFETLALDSDGQPIDICRVSGGRIWNFGVKVCATKKMEEREYTLSDVADRFGAGKAPMTYAELFAGDYDIIRLFADAIMEDYGIEE